MGVKLRLLLRRCKKLGELVRLQFQQWQAVAHTSAMTPLTNVDQFSDPLAAGRREDLPRQRVNHVVTSQKPGHAVDFTLVRRVKEPTRLGRYVLSRMRDVGMTKQVDLVRASGTDPATGRPHISESTVSRIILSDEYIPNRDTIVALAKALRVDPKALLLFIFELGDTPATQTPLHPRAAEVDRLLGDASRLSDEDKALYDTMIARLIEPPLKAAGRKRAG